MFGHSFLKQYISKSTKLDFFSLLGSREYSCSDERGNSSEGRSEHSPARVELLVRIARVRSGRHSQHGP